MRKNKIILGLAFLIFFLSFLVFLYLKNDSNLYDDSSNKVSLGKCAFDIESVSNEEQRKKGLSDRDLLCRNCGMLFLFDKEGDYFFWMKDMRFPIDIIWIRNNQVVSISQKVNHQSKSVYSSKEKADKVLELNANDVSRCEIKIGDKLRK